MATQREIRSFAATGMLGSGFPKESLKKALKMDPHFIGCDSGSTDPGPYQLGADEPLMPRAACKRDIGLLIVGALEKKIPLIIGSAGGAGTDKQLMWLSEIVQEVSKENNLHFKMSLIRAEQKKDYLKKKLIQKKIVQLGPVPELTLDKIDKSEHIVGVMGAELFIKALENGAQIIIAGRSTDASIFAAFPLMKGASPGPVWHSAKVLECGAAAVEHRVTTDCMMAFIKDNYFIVKPPNPKLRCLPLTVAAHTLYENASPYLIYEPSGIIDTRNCSYEKYGVTGVKVTDSNFIPTSKYRIKLEGAEKANYQTIAIAGIRDPIVIRRIDPFLAEVREKAQKKTEEYFKDGLIKRCNYTINFRIYGKNGVMGKMEPIKDIHSHELCLIMEVVADTKESSITILNHVLYIALHNPSKEWQGMVTNLAIPYAPFYICRGMTYRFNIHHLVEPDDPYEMFPIEFIKV